MDLDTTPVASAQGAKPLSGGFCFSKNVVKTIIYVDGFNLYYGATRGTPYRWLDLGKLCRIMLPLNEISEIKYFTALVKPRPNDPEQPIRQQIYLRALKTIPNLTIIYGHYLSHAVMMPLANSVETKPEYIRVIKTEEKGSDVNLATHLLNDAYQRAYEIGVVVSNDSDLVEPIKIIVNQMKLKIGVLNPHKHPSQVLLKYATFFKSIRRSALTESQFPPILQTQHGTIHKPASW